MVLQTAAACLLSQLFSVREAAAVTVQKVTVPLLFPITLPVWFPDVASLQKDLFPKQIREAVKSIASPSALCVCTHRQL